jgi:predicted RNA binding protein YcfA (HicA-like mRNA interferase family)
MGVTPPPARYDPRIARKGARRSAESRGTLAWKTDGWHQVRTRGSHRQFRRPDERGTVIVSGKRSIDVPPGTLISDQHSRAQGEPVPMPSSEGAIVETDAA